MPISFQAATVDINTPKWGVVVTFSADYEEDAEEERYVTLQRKNEFSRQDIALGMDNVHIECCGQGWSWYGHIKSVVLSRNHLDINLDREAAEYMFSDGCIEVKFYVDSTKYVELQTALRQIFRNADYYQEI